MDVYYFLIHPAILCLLIEEFSPFRDIESLWIFKTLLHNPEGQSCQFSIKLNKLYTCMYTYTGIPDIISIRQNYKCSLAG